MSVEQAGPGKWIVRGSASREELSKIPIDDEIVEWTSEEEEGGELPVPELAEDEGRKDDRGKPRFSLVPLNALSAMIDTLEDGAIKYAVDNWKHVPDRRTRYYNALMRHMFAWWSGERNDPESGRNHLAHAACCLFFLLSEDLEEEQKAEVWFNAERPHKYI